MIVFVEGADGSGKTTLVNQLRGIYPVFTVPRDYQVDVPYIWAEIYEAAQGTVFVTDRCFISDYIYRLHDLLDGTYNLKGVLSLIKDNVFIYCKTDTQHDDAIARGEDNIVNRDDADDLRKLYDVFMRILKKEKVRVMEYDWKTQNVHDVLDFIENCTKEV